MVEGICYRFERQYKCDKDKCEGDLSVWFYTNESPERIVRCPECETWQVAHSGIERPANRVLIEDSGHGALTLKSMEESIVEIRRFNERRAAEEQEEELEACPFCRYKAPRVYQITSMSSKWCVLCGDCGMQGPVGKIEEEARRLWNGCPR